MKMSVVEFIEGELGIKIHVVSDRGWARACCSYHDETRPSFGINTEWPFQVACFGCGKKTSIVGLIAHVLHMNIDKARLLFNECVDVQLAAEKKKRKPQEVVPDALESMLEECFPGSIAEKYARYRGIPKYMSRLWCMGYDELNNALTVPMRRTSDGKIVGHYGVQIQGTFDEVYKEKGCVEAGKTVTVPGNFNDFGDCLVTEGYVDAIKAAEVFWRNGKFILPVALNTCYPSAEQLSYIRKFKRVFLGFDHDQSGQKAKEYCRGKLKDKGFLFDVIYPESRKDLGELLPQDEVTTKLMV